MLPDMGYIFLLLGLAISLYVIAAYLIGARTGNQRLLESAKGGAGAVCLLVTISSFILIYALMTSDFSVKYVARYTSTDLLTLYKFSAFWAGNEGSLLLWLWTIVGYGAVIAYSKRHQLTQMNPYVLSIVMFNAVFFFVMIIFVANPFERLPVAPSEGNGLNPMLQHPGMVVHPVTTYLGYVGFLIPFAYAMAALILRRVDDVWIKITRRWTVIAWLFLTLGNMYGGQWAYVELGWGGMWAWDPVENASFMPWLTGSAFLHSVMIQERKDMLKIWNISLIILTYGLTLFGTFLVRSGILSSIHAFADSNIGLYILMFLGVMMIGALYILLDRIDLLREQNEIQSFLSKESSFLINNLLLVGSTFAVFWGTVFPLVSEAVTQTKVTVGAPFYNQVVGPILLAMILVMAICPLIAWQRSSWKSLWDNFAIPLVLAIGLGLGLFFFGITKPWAVLSAIVISFAIITHLQEFVRGTLARSRLTGEGAITALRNLLGKNRRRYGGYIIHLGIFMLAAAMVGEGFYGEEKTTSVRAGEIIQIGQYDLLFNKLDAKREGPNEIVFADMSVYKGDEFLGKMYPEKIFYPTWDQPRTNVAVRGTLAEDLYIVLAGWDQDGTTALKIDINPLMMWAWIGMYTMILGTLFALWPGKGSDLGPKYHRRI
jgi:cytochrome c-type biogenesis protein CcmF